MLQSLPILVRTELTPAHHFLWPSQPKVPSRVDLGMGQIHEGKNGCGWSHPQVPAHSMLTKDPAQGDKGLGRAGVRGGHGS